MLCANAWIAAFVDLSIHRACRGEHADEHPNERAASGSTYETPEPRGRQLHLGRAVSRFLPCCARTRGSQRLSISAYTERAVASTLTSTLTSAQRPGRRTRRPSREDDNCTSDAQFLVFCHAVRERVDRSVCRSQHTQSVPWRAR